MIDGPAFTDAMPGGGGARWQDGASVRVGSIPPPSFRAAQQRAEPPGAALNPDLAVRSRLNAFAIDSFLLGVASRLLAPALGVRLFSANYLLLLLVVQFLYFFYYEGRTGQTIGKRSMRVRVVAVDGSEPTLGQIALRNLLRVADAVPMLYASGLISMMRTGRARRQRLGDMAAKTIVVVDGDARPLVRTPGWLLPVVTLCAAGLSVLVFVAGHGARHSSDAALAEWGSGGPIPTARGFPGNNNAQPPQPGFWTATGTTISSTGYGDVVTGEQQARLWRIEGRCAAGPCTYMLSRQMNGGSQLSARLIPGRDGWHATFPDRYLVCATAGGRDIYWPQRSTWVMRFSANGFAAQVHERNFSFAAGCGYGTDTVEWSATRR